MGATTFATKSLLVLLLLVSLASYTLQTCDSNCLYCSGTTCLQCTNSILNNGSCSTDNDLPDNCMIGTSTECTHCVKGYGLAPTGVCIKCTITDCQVCEFPMGKEVCSTCKGLATSNGKSCALTNSIDNCLYGGPDRTCAVCKAEFKLSSDRRSCTDKNCLTGCLSCSSASTC